MKQIRCGTKLIVAFLLGSTMALGATARQWQSGKLLDTEQQKVSEGSTTTYNTDGQAKNKRSEEHTSELQSP